MLNAKFKSQKFTNEIFMTLCLQCGISFKDTVKDAFRQAIYDLFGGHWFKVGGKYTYSVFWLLGA